METTLDVPTFSCATCLPSLASLDTSPLKSTFVLCHVRGSVQIFLLGPSRSDVCFGSDSEKTENDDVPVDIIKSIIALIVPGLSTIKP